MQAGSGVRSGFLPQNRLRVMRFEFARCELAEWWVRRPQLSHVGSCRIWLTRWSRNCWAHPLSTSPPRSPATFSTRRRGCVPRNPCSAGRALPWSLQRERCAHACARSQQWDKPLLSRFSCVRLCATPWTAAPQAPLSTGFSRQEDKRDSQRWFTEEEGPASTASQVPPSPSTVSRFI